MRFCSELSAVQSLPTNCKNVALLNFAILMLIFRDSTCFYLFSCHTAPTSHWRRDHASLRTRGSLEFTPKMFRLRYRRPLETQVEGAGLREFFTRIVETTDVSVSVRIFLGLSKNLFWASWCRSGLIWDRFGIDLGSI